MALELYSSDLVLYLYRQSNHIVPSKSGARGLISFCSENEVGAGGPTALGDLLVVGSRPAAGTYYGLESLFMRLGARLAHEVLSRNSVWVEAPEDAAASTEPRQGRKTSCRKVFLSPRRGSTS
jgi:hypothetical protein